MNNLMYSQHIDIIIKFIKIKRAGFESKGCYIL